MDLDPAVAAAGVGLFVHDDIDSTNAEALRRARSGLSGPLWITARTQSAGRGRRGRAWISVAGNLYATLLISDPSPPDLAPQLSFVAALALTDAILALAPELAPRLDLKWPNDLLCDDRKLAGILIEGEGTRPLSIATGIGVNCAHHPDDADYPATDLRTCGVPITPDRLFHTLSATMMHRLSQWDQGRRFDAIRNDWLRRTSGIGTDIRVRLLERDLTGRFESLDATGRLILRLADGSAETISAGDVFPLVGVLKGQRQA
jgi:BirA family transcriptional regulator, biotin operon repressor / biotin---[acetyl-CoA-carboxylase] ligase